MEVAVAVGAGIVLVVIVTALVRRRGGREAQSVAGYRRALDVLGQVAEGEGSTRAQATPGPGSVPDDRTIDRRRAGAGRDRSLLVMERPARRLGAPLAALLVVAAVGGATYLVVRAHHVTPPPKQSASAGSRRHAPGSKRVHAPATTAPRRYVAVASTGTSATYVPVTSTYSLTVGATKADCWMSVTSADGTTVLEQTFAPGASASLSLTGPSTVLLGAPGAATVSVGGVPVVLPSAVSGPFTVSLSPA